jgi:hypothetical protein
VPILFQSSSPRCERSLVSAPQNSGADNTTATLADGPSSRPVSGTVISLRVRQTSVSLMRKSGITVYVHRQYKQQKWKCTSYRLPDLGAGVIAPKRSRRSELATTLTEEKPIAAPAMIGLSKPAAANGIVRTL